MKLLLLPLAIVLELVGVVLVWFIASLATLANMCGRSCEWIYRP